MREALPAIIASAIIALIVGAAGTYFIFYSQQAPAERTPEDRVGPVKTSTKPEAHEATAARPDTTAPVTDSARLLKEAKDSADKARAELDTVRKERDTLAGEKEKLAARVSELETKVKELSPPPETKHELPISFGKWGDVKEVREADWNDLGDAYVKMTPLLKAYADAVAQGKTVDPETAKEIQKQNGRLVEYFLKVRGKLPTNNRMNGEFTHPINLVNFLAGQLASLDMPLTDEQKRQLADLGTEYDQRWDKLQAGYNDETWELQKIVDEADLKQWFYEEMFKVTTTEQRNAAVPPEIQGMIGLDLYSPGLMLQGHLAPSQTTDMAHP